MKKSVRLMISTSLLFTTAPICAAINIYGVVDTGIGYEQHKTTNRLGFEHKQKKFGLYDQGFMGNRIGFKGSEDLGQGLRINFILEMGFDLGVGSTRLNRLFGRQAMVGLEDGRWGRIDLGRQVTPTSQFFSPIASPFGGNGYQYGVGATFASSNTVRYDNMLAFQSSDVYGLRFGVGYSFNTNGPQQYRHVSTNEALDPDQGNIKALTVAARYHRGRFKAALTFDEAKYGSVRIINNTLNPSISGKVKAWNLGFSYDFDGPTLHLGVGQSRDGFIGNSLQNRQLGGGLQKGLKLNSYTVGGALPIGRVGKIMASWGMTSPRSMPHANDDSYNQQVYSVGYRHMLSKRTQLYTIGSYARHVGFYKNSTSSVVTVGLAHSF